MLFIYVVHCNIMYCLFTNVHSNKEDDLAEYVALQSLGSFCPLRPTNKYFIAKHQTSHGFVCRIHTRAKD